MQRIFAARWPIGIFVALLLAVWAGTTAWRGKGVPWNLASDEFAAERHELEFWQAALKRIDAELAEQRNGPASASLQAERQIVLEHAREVAGRVPRHDVPPDIRVLLDQVPTPASAPAQPSAPVQPDAPAPASAPALAVGPAAPLDLRVGLTPPTPAPDFSDITVAPVPPLPVFVERRRRGGAHPPSDETSEREVKRPTPSGAADRSDKRPAASATADREQKRPAPR